MAARIVVSLTADFHRGFSRIPAIWVSLSVSIVGETSRMLTQTRAFSLSVPSGTFRRASQTADRLQTGLDQQVLAVKPIGVHRRGKYSGDDRDFA
jgi:hypothetical protein